MGNTYKRTSYQPVSTIGGTVEVVLSKADKRRYARKRLKIPATMSDEVKRKVAAESKAQLALAHPFIQQLCDIYSAKNKDGDEFHYLIY